MEDLSILLIATLNFKILVDKFFFSRHKWFKESHMIRRQIYGVLGLLFFLFLLGIFLSNIQTQKLLKGKIGLLRWITEEKIDYSLLESVSTPKYIISLTKCRIYLVRNAFKKWRKPALYCKHSWEIKKTIMKFKYLIYIFLFLN